MLKLEKITTSELRQLSQICDESSLLDLRNIFLDEYTARKANAAAKNRAAYEQEVAEARAYNKIINGSLSQNHAYDYYGNSYS